MTIVDAHAYIGESLYGQTRAVDELLREMDRLKVDRSGLCPNKPFGYHLAPANRLVANAVKSHPNRFFGWARVDPWQGKAALTDLKIGIEELELRGLLLHPYEELFQVSHHLVDPLLEYAGKRKIPVMVESGYHLLSHPLDMAELAHRFPAVTIIGTHGLQLDDAGFALTDAELAMKESPNLIMESSGMYAPDTMLNVVNTFGSQRLIFGSHSPWLNQEFELERIERMDLTAEQKKAIQGDTILKLIFPEKESK